MKNLVAYKSKLQCEKCLLLLERQADLKLTWENGIYCGFRYGFMLFFSRSTLVYTSVFVILEVHV